MRAVSPKVLVPLSLALVVGLGACASSGTGTGTAPRGSSTRIVASDFEEMASEDVYTIVQRMRPRWLQVRGGTTAQGRALTAIFIDGVRQSGSVEILRGLRGSDVEEVRYMNARDATTRWGTDMMGGAIEVFTKH